jgi:pimeloyl-ACP methyl ester carboxylesterase
VSPNEPVSSYYFAAPDGLKLHALVAGPRASPWLPVVCLPGIARTSEDFRETIEALAFDPDRPRRVLALDSRGRGLSARDPNPDNYSVPVELGDVLALLDANAVERAVFIGTSRGGILTMTMSMARPSAIAGAVLNDIGPLIEMAGLLRIKSYVGKLPRPSSYEDAVRIMSPVMAAQFPGFTDADWLRYVRRTFQAAAGGGLELRYDPAISLALATVDPAVPAPPLWPQFDALPQVPLMVIRGEHSDLLSRATVAEMRARRPDLEVVEVVGQGHAPMLTDGSTLGPIAKFVARCDVGPSDSSRPQ